MYKSITRGYTDYKCNECAKSVSTLKVEPFIIRKILRMTELKKLNNQKEAEEVITLQNKINKKINNMEEEKIKLIDFLTKNYISEEEFIKSKKRIDDKIKFEHTNKKKYESIISFKDKKGMQKDNLEILRFIKKM